MRIKSLILQLKQNLFNLKTQNTELYNEKTLHSAIPKT